MFKHNYAKQAIEALHLRIYQKPLVLLQGAKITLHKHFVSITYKAFFSFFVFCFFFHVKYQNLSKVYPPLSSRSHHPRVRDYSMSVNCFVLTYVLEF